jgi:hypothetical protein
VRCEGAGGERAAEKGPQAGLQAGQWLHPSAPLPFGSSRPHLASLLGDLLPAAGPTAIAALVGSPHGRQSRVQPVAGRPPEQRRRARQLLLHPPLLLLPLLLLLLLVVII